MTSTPSDPTPSDPTGPFGANQPPYPGAEQPPAAPYGAFPTGPAGGSPQAPAAPPQPASIVLAVKLMYAGAAIALLGLIYTLATLGGLKDDLRDQLLENDPNTSQSTIDAAYGVAIAFAIVFGLIGALLWVWMAWKNGQGRSWARIVATVFGVFNVIGVLFTLAGGNAEPLSLILTVISAGLGIVVLVLLYKKESTQFYEGVAASRRLY